MFDEFDDELDSIVEKDNELSEDSLDDDSDKTDSGKVERQVSVLFILLIVLEKFIGVQIFNEFNFYHQSNVFLSMYVIV